jgi:hypothetical protein
MKKVLLVSFVMLNVLSLQADNVSGGISERELIIGGYEPPKDKDVEDRALARNIFAMLDERNDLSEDKRDVFNFAAMSLVLKSKKCSGIGLKFAKSINNMIDEEADLSNVQRVALNRAAKYLTEPCFASKE